MNRSQRAHLAQETLDILEQGYYIYETGTKVFLQTEQENALHNSQHYSPESFASFNTSLATQLKQTQFKTHISVTNETTLKAAQRLIIQENKQAVVGLNFASAKNPGGGFLNGSQAQEESLSRSSGLYPCIVQMQDMYTYNRENKSGGYYSDHMIYSPKVPVFREDNGHLLEKPYLFSIITAPAVNAGVIKREKGTYQEKIYQVMLERSQKVLSLAAIHQEKHLILGAWGCGVFQNDATMIADVFYTHLVLGEFSQAFESIIFAIKGEGAILEAFQKRFS